jgi:hypothetical protein
MNEVMKYACWGVEVKLPFFSIIKVPVGEFDSFFWIYWHVLDF